LEVYSNGTVLAETTFLNIDAEVLLLCIAPSDNLIELRIKNHGAGVHVTGISLTPMPHSRLTEEKQLWTSAVGRLILDQIICPAPGGDANLINPGRAAELLFERESMLKIALPDIEATHDELQRRGIDPLLARALFEDIGYSNWTGADEHVPELVAFPPVNHTFQSQIVQEGRLHTLSPVTRDWVEARSSLPISAGAHMPIAYEFFGEAPMIAFSNAGWGGAISFVWLVKQDVLLIDDRNWCIGFDGAGLISQYFAICLQYREEIATYRASNKTVAAAIGYQPNLGHFYWNDVSGLEREARLDRLPKIACFYQRPLPWTDIAYLHPEVNDRVKRVRETDLLMSILDEKRIVVRLTASAIDAGLSERVYQSAVRALEAEDRTRLTLVTDHVASRKTFKLFLNLRAHNKAWLEQEVGLSMIIEAALARHENLTVYLDGMPDCREIADTLTRAFRDRCTVVDGLQVSFAETLLWSFGCDAYVAVIGSGLVPLTWLADRPGVAHSNRGHHDQIESFWRRVRQSTQPLLLPTLDQINDEGDGIYANYSIDPQIIAGLFEKVLNASPTGTFPKPRRLRDAIASTLRLV
jgi:hypothetical protein